MMAPNGMFSIISLRVRSGINATGHLMIKINTCHIAICTALVFSACTCLSQDAGLVHLPATQNEVDVGEFSGPIGDWLLDLDIDSDNNNMLELPDGSEWEEQIEEHEFSIGKLVEARAARFTPVRIRLNIKALKQLDDTPRTLDDIRVTLATENAKGVIRLFSKPQIDKRDDVDGLLHPEKELQLEELNFDPATGVATIWIEAVEAAPGLDTKGAIDQHGRPDMFLRATLLGIRKTELAIDRVKYLPVDQASFFPTFIDPNNRHIRNSFPAIFVNGSGGLSGTMKQLPPEQSKTYGFRLVTEEEFASELAISKHDELTKKYLIDVIYNKTDLIPISFGVTGFQVGLYRDYSFGDYTLAFQNSLKDKCTQLYFTFAQLDNSSYYFERRGADYISYRNHAERLSYYLGFEDFAVGLPGLQLAGVGIGGDLALFGALGSGLHADTYNTKPFPGEMVKTIVARDDPAQKKLIECVSGSLSRLDRAREFITAYFVDETDFRLAPGPFPIVSAK